MAQPVRIALVGAGSMGSNHARVISQHPDTDLAVLVDPREAVGREVAAKYGTSWAPELPSLAQIDAVVVAAATESHYPLAKHVLSEDTALLVEKPVADSLSDTIELLDLATERDLPMMCGLLERFNPAILTARQILGNPVHIVATRHSPYAPRIKTGVAWDLLVHDVDLVIQLMNDLPSVVNAQLGFYHPDSDVDAEDVAETLLHFENGGLGRISASRIGQKKIREVMIYEKDRLIEVDLLRRGVTVYSHVSASDVAEGRGFRQQTVIEIPELVTNVEPLTGQLDHFLQIIRGTKDAQQERTSILPSHQVVDSVVHMRDSSSR